MYAACSKNDGCVLIQAIPYLTPRDDSERLRVGCSVSDPRSCGWWNPDAPPPPPAPIPARCLAALEAACGSDRNSSALCLPCLAAHAAALGAAGCTQACGSFCPPDTREHDPRDTTCKNLHK